MKKETSQLGSPVGDRECQCVDPRMGKSIAPRLAERNVALGNVVCLGAIATSAVRCTTSGWHSYGPLKARMGSWKCVIGFSHGDVMSSDTDQKRFNHPSMSP